MKHTDSIAERLFHLGETPTIKPEPINDGKTLEEMIAQDVRDEKKAIDMYKEVIAEAQKEGDATTAFLFMEILKEEEHHHDTFTTLLEQVSGNPHAIYGWDESEHFNFLSRNAIFNRKPVGKWSCSERLHTPVTRKAELDWCRCGIGGGTAE